MTSLRDDVSQPSSLSCDRRGYRAACQAGRIFVMTRD
jgi:hypothetical protein